MTERYLHQVRVELPPADESAPEARVRLAEKFPRTALRRMTHLGLLIGSTLEGIPLGTDDAVVYASTFAETRALEDFLSSFPSASPLLFQTSIHPGGVQQVLIGRQKPVARLWPLAGRARLVEHALMTSLMEPADKVVVIGGEERGTWLLEQKIASARAFAFTLVMSRVATGALGRIGFKSDSNTSDAVPSLETFTLALAARKPLSWRSGAGTWMMEWS